jgi:hypothetical protein
MPRSRANSPSGGEFDRIHRIDRIGIEMKDGELTHRITGCGYTVHNTLGTGFLEKVYENALCIELRKAGLQVEQQAPITVRYDDLLVEERVIVEV